MDDRLSSIADEMGARYREKGRLTLFKERTKLIDERTVELDGEAVAGEKVMGAGLLMGAHEEIHHKMSTSESHIQELWTTAAFLVTTILYVLIGAEIRIDAFFGNAGLVVSAAILVVVVRAATIYPLVSGTNLIRDQPVPLHCQHVMVWGGLHTVVPVALVLSLPQGFPFREELQVMVFGVAVISIVVQGLLMPAVLTRLGLGNSSGG